MNLSKLINLIGEVKTKVQKRNGMRPQPDCDWGCIISILRLGSIEEVDRFVC